MHTLFPASTTSSTPYTGLAGFPLLISRVDTGKSLSRSRIRRKQHFAQAVANSLSLIRSPLASATLPPPSPASWIASSPVSTGRHASSTLMISSYSPPRGKSTFERLRQVFERLRHAKLKLGAEKCTFAAKEVSYLGHRVTGEGLLPDPALLAAIREIHPPKNATEVRSFLALAGYYRRYVKNFAAIAGPLHALTRKDAVFHWSSECQDAFDRLKTLLTTSPIIAFPTSAYLSVSIRTRRLQASARFTLKSRKAKNVSSAVHLAPSTKQRKPTPPLRWNASPLFGPLQNSVHTSCLCHSRFTQTTTLCNGSKQ